MRYILLCLIFSSSAVASDVYFVTSSNSDSNQNAARLISERLVESDPNIHFQIRSLTNFKSQELNADDLIVTIGSAAAESIQSANLANPVLFSFTTQSSLPQTAGNWAALITEQPLSRLIQTTPPLIENSFKKQILVPVSPSNKTIINSAEQLEANGLKLIQIPDTEKPAKKVDSQLFKSGALIAVKDKHIWSGENARWMLYQAYRNNVPVIGYSKKFLKAGALVAIYSTLDQIAENTAQQISDWSQNQQLQQKGVIFSKYNIEYNKKIARTLKISVPENKFNVESDK
jgi:putative ABC transport system substrate-binding protein